MSNQSSTDRRIPDRGWTGFVLFKKSNPSLTQICFWWIHILSKINCWSGVYKARKLRSQTVEVTRRVCVVWISLSFFLYRSEVWACKIWLQPYWSNLEWSSSNIALAGLKESLFVACKLPKETSDSTDWPHVVMSRHWSCRSFILTPFPPPYFLSYQATWTMIAHYDLAESRNEIDFCLTVMGVPPAGILQETPFN